MRPNLKTVTAAALLTALVATALGAGVASGAKSSGLIRVLSSGKVTSVGDFKPSGNLKLRKAIRAFGTPSSRKPVGDGRTACKVLWKTRGLQVTSTNFGRPPAGRTTCQGDHGFVQVIAVRGKAAKGEWRTNRGLRVGSSLKRLKNLYPKARHHRRGEWWLITDGLPYGEGPSPILYAQVTKKRVSSISVWVGGAGD